MANLQIRINDELKTQADALFSSLGLDTSTAVRIFLTASLEYNGLPFEVKHHTLSDEMCQAIYESRNRINLNGTYQTAEEAVKSMLEE
ncbi:MAG: type II toxin-antitoxin system RelB/DinJ family antitoxin [Oscillospiraceae bacterium]|nr:type II toxin-antitoxin system RelB/DinJ family antitoxin [Oscillospiraceae bacterium]MBR7084058.1 type II toxin-antitoxin system RelB/DinJ family antitoxin [Oscillospiraceae bacterium]